MLLSAGLAGALLLVMALLLDRSAASRPLWEGPLEFAPDRREYLPRCTLPLEADRTTSLTLFWVAEASACVKLHIRSDEGACLGERTLRLEPVTAGRPARLHVTLRAAVAGPHTFIWQAVEGAASTAYLRVRTGDPLPALPLCAAAAAFVLVGVAGLAGLKRAAGQGGAGTQAQRRHRISRGTILGIAIAAALVVAMKAAEQPLVLQPAGPVEEP
jgi:hypothetical protein